MLEGENAPVEIVLGGDAASVSGSVAAAGFVVAVRDGSIVASQPVSADGAFGIQGLAPGDYVFTAVPSRPRQSPEAVCGARSQRLHLEANDRRVLALELCDASAELRD